MASRAGVLGRPIAHSLSPVLHRAAYAALGLDWTYAAIDCGVDELPQVLGSRADWVGFSATMPLKHALLDVASDVRPLAAEVGAANTLLAGRDGWLADNTDVPGFVGALGASGIAPSSVTILGAGGTAQAAVAALWRLGLTDCNVLVREATRAGALLATAERVGMSVVLGDLDVSSASLAADLVISTLPPGAADSLADRAWSVEQAVLDVVYAPWPTALAQAAGAAGATVVNGAVLLLHQAAEQVHLMTGQPAPTDVMRAALDAALTR